MQKMDRNSIIGFVLLAILLFAYLFISSKNTRELEAKKKLYEDSVGRVQVIKNATGTKIDSVKKILTTGDTSGFNKAAVAGEQVLVLENELISVTLTNKGAQPKKVLLKKFNSFQGQPVQLVGDDNDKISYSINIAPNQSAQSSDLFFTPGTITKNADGSQALSFQLIGAGGESITHQYTIKPNSYFVDFTIQLNNTEKLLSQNSFNLLWQTQMVPQEKDAKYERQQSQLCYVANGDFDYHNLNSSDTKKLEKMVNWVSVKQQFFNTTLIAKNNFDAGQVDWSAPVVDTLHQISLTKVNFNTKLSGTSVAIPMQFFYGPNDYKILRNSGINKLDKIVNLGQGLYAFVRPINQYIILPVFDFFKKYISSYGVVILLLTLFIRLLTSPLVYTSYLSGAKMKALRPEIDVIKKKYADDQQQFGMEQMKLFREAGVNPLGGCIPALLQIPIFFALYSFFNANIALRGESFLWSKDLSSYDSIITFGSKIPLIGDHISLFTLLAVITSFLISLYGMANTPDQNNPALKYMPYIFPFMLLFIFNGLPSALTWYYTVSNIITLILQFVIQNYIIDHTKILAQLAENKKKPKTQSKWQERLQQMQESQKKVQEMQQKNKGK